MNFVLIIFCLLALVVSLYLYDKYLFKSLPESSEDVESYYNTAARRYGEIGLFLTSIRSAEEE